MLFDVSQYSVDVYINYTRFLISEVMLIVDVRVLILNNPVGFDVNFFKML